MEFRTELKNVSLPFDIKLSDPLFFIGSCFAENISGRFSSSKFSICSNPFGTLYNPISISEALQDIASKTEYLESIVVENLDVFYSWKHHGSLTAMSSYDLIEKANLLNLESHLKLVQSKYLFITLGSAWAYKLKSTGQLVANCHKIPAQEFEKVLIDSNEIFESYKTTIPLLKELNPNLSIVFTVSPVRHSRDGLIENNRSKAELIKATHQLCEVFSFCNYLPVYEWVIDDLRDYRFFEKDLVHPNQLAQDYIWEKLNVALFSDKTQAELKTIKGFLSGVAHRPFNAKTKQHIAFLTKLHKTGIQLQQELGINITNDLKELETLISENV